MILGENMKKVWDRLMTYRMNRSLWKRMFHNDRMGQMDHDNHKLISRGANIVLLTFVIRLFSRLWIMGSTFFETHEFQAWPSFIGNNWLSLLILLLIYLVFSNYLLGISFRDQKTKRYARKYLKILVFILLYLIEIGVSFFYFINTLYDYYFLSLISLVSLIGTLYAYFIIFISVLDFCIYTTDNSDDISLTKGDTIDYF